MHTLGVASLSVTYPRIKLIKATLRLSIALSEDYCAIPRLVLLGSFFCSKHLQRVKFILVIINTYLTYAPILVTQALP